VYPLYIFIFRLSVFAFSSFRIVGRRCRYLHRRRSLSSTSPHFPYLYPYLTVHMHMLPCPRSLLLHPASVSVSLLCYFFLASSLYLSDSSGTSTTLQRHSYSLSQEASIALHFGFVSLFRPPFTFRLSPPLVFILAFTFHLAPTTISQFHNPTAPSTYPPTHPRSPRNPTTRIPPPHLACIPSLRFAFFSFLTGVGVGV